MFTRVYLIVGVFALLLFLSISCAGGGPTDKTPITPDLTHNNKSLEAGRYLWAYYEIFVDPIENSYEISPLRQSMDHWNILKFLEQGPCTNCVSILSVTDTPQGTKLFDVQITHPFPSANLTGFDVRGIAMFTGTHVFPSIGLNTPDCTLCDGELINADGYTTLYNGTTTGSGPEGLQGYQKGKFSSPLVPNATLNGYKRHISPDPGNTRNAFYANSSIIETYEIDMPDIQFIFGYAVDASWAAPIVKPVTDPMVDFPPEANCPEPWKIEVFEEPIDQGLTDLGGQTKLILDVYDHQGKDTLFTPFVECKHLFDGTVNALWAEDGDGFTRFEVTIENEKIAKQGEYLCLIAVEDVKNNTAPDWLDLTAYQIVTLIVAEGIPMANQPPTAAAHADPDDPLIDQDVDFFDDSTDPDGPADIVHWEWDFSYDPGDGFQVESEDQNPAWQYSSVGIYEVQLSVSDTEFHWDMLDEPLIITVSKYNEPPVAAAHSDATDPFPNQPVCFFDDSTDPDGPEDIIKWEWDFSYDPIDGFHVESEEQNPTNEYPDVGIYKIQFRVTDTEEHSDMLDTALTINVQEDNNSPPIACADADTQNPNIETAVDFTSCSQDPNGIIDIVLYEWDLDGDGAYETIEINPSWTYNEAGDFPVQHRVTDSADHVDDLDEPFLIEVNGPPVADAEASAYDITIGEFITLTNLSVDDDGNGPIVHVYWDINGNGEYDDPEDIADQDVVEILLCESGINEIGLKVIDSNGLEDELDEPLVINVEGFEPFCIELIDWYNSADHLYGTRTFNYYQASIEYIEGLDYQDSDGPWDFTGVPEQKEKICRWVPSTDPVVVEAADIWPDAEFFFEGPDPLLGDTVWLPYRYDFVDAANGEVVLQGQWVPGFYFDYGEIFKITTPICHPWSDSGSGAVSVVIDDQDIILLIDWDMETVGTGPAIFMIDDQIEVINCILIRSHSNFVDTEYELLDFSILTYQWLDEDGNEVAVMFATNGLPDDNFSGDTYTAITICRPQISTN